MTDVSSATATTPAIATGTASSNASNLTSGQTNLDTSYSTFLTLLTTQLKNQDPTSPLDTNQFTQQLVQMTGVQQQLLSNELLQQLVNQGGGAGGVSSAVGLIGKTVTATADTAVLNGGQAGWSYTLPAGAASASLTVSDASGRTVWSGAASDLSAGSHAFSWNGRSTSGSQLADGGAYKLSVSAVDGSGAALAPTVQLTGVVTSVQTVNGATVVDIGKSQAPYTSVTAVQGG